MRISIIALLVALVNGAAGQSPPASAMVEDFDALHQAILEAHGGLYRHADKDAMAKFFNQQRAKAGKLTTRYDFISLVSETLAGLRDGHMRLEYDQQTTSEIAAAKLIPFRFQVEDSKLVVLFNDTKADRAIHPGSEVISINGHPAAELIESMLPKVSGDGFIVTGKLFTIARNFPSYYWLFIDQQSSFKIVCRESNGPAVATTVEGVVNSERLANRKSNPVNAGALKYFPSSTRKNITLQFLEDTNIASISVREFGGSDFKEELDSVFLAIRNKKSKAVILDLRGNGGGVDSYGAYLVSQFTDRPFRYFDHIHLRDIDPSFTSFTSQTYADLKSGTTVDPNGGYLVTPKLHPQVGEQQPGRYPFSGKLVVLMNGGTFSTAADVTAVLHNMKRGVFIGEESGGGYEGNTSGTNARVTLPNSKLSVRVQMYDYWNAVTVKEKGRGTLPDYPLRQKVADIVRGQDLQMSEAIAQVSDAR
jgi:hypothetical protein